LKQKIVRTIGYFSAFSKGLCELFDAGTQRSWRGAADNRMIRCATRTPRPRSQQSAVTGQQRNQRLKPIYQQKSLNKNNISTESNAKRGTLRFAEFVLRCKV